MCDPIVIGKYENDSLTYTWLNILVILEAEGNWNGLSVVLPHHAVELAAKVLKTILKSADTFIYFCLLLHGDPSSIPEASCSSTRQTKQIHLFRCIISDQAMHLPGLEPDEQVAEISLPIVCDKECICLLSWLESSVGPKSCHSVLSLEEDNTKFTPEAYLVVSLNFCLMAGFWKRLKIFKHVNLYSQMWKTVKKWEICTCTYIILYSGSFSFWSINTIAVAKKEFMPAL